MLTQTSGATLTLEIGTSSGGSQTKSATLTIANGNEVSLTETTFTATTHHVSFTESSGNAAFVKLVELSEDVLPIPLKYLSYEEYNDAFRERDTRPDTDKFTDPEYVYSPRTTMRLV